eukprot:m.5724 g.5724  ORF g.5724 m.5724 type:complete len:892 (+) comp2029_c0_seq1:25-2700(+)
MPLPRPTSSSRRRTFHIAIRPTAATGCSRIPADSIAVTTKLACHRQSRVLPAMAAQRRPRNTEHVVVAPRTHALALSTTPAMRYDEHVFQQLAGPDGRVAYSDLVALLAASGLPQRIHDKIWERAVGSPSRSSLDRDIFCMAMRLTALAQQGIDPLAAKLDRAEPLPLDDRTAEAISAILADRRSSLSTLSTLSETEEPTADAYRALSVGSSPVSDITPEPLGHDCHPLVSGPSTPTSNDIIEPSQKPARTSASRVGDATSTASALSSATSDSTATPDTAIRAARVIIHAFIQGGLVGQSDTDDPEPPPPLPGSRSSQSTDNAPHPHSIALGMSDCLASASSGKAPLSPSSPERTLTSISPLDSASVDRINSQGWNIFNCHAQPLQRSSPCVASVIRPSARMKPPSWCKPQPSTSRSSSVPSSHSIASISPSPSTPGSQSSTPSTAARAAGGTPSSSTSLSPTGGWPSPALRQGNSSRANRSLTVRFADPPVRLPPSHEYNHLTGHEPHPPPAPSYDHIKAVTRWGVARPLRRGNRSLSPPSTSPAPPTCDLVPYATSADLPHPPPSPRLGSAIQADSASLLSATTLEQARFMLGTAQSSLDLEPPADKAPALPPRLRIASLAASDSPLACPSPEQVQASAGPDPSTPGSPPCAGEVHADKPPPVPPRIGSAIRAASTPPLRGTDKPPPLPPRRVCSADLLGSDPPPPLPPRRTGSVPGYSGSSLLSRSSPPGFTASQLEHSAPRPGLQLLAAVGKNSPSGPIFSVSVGQSESTPSSCTSRASSAGGSWSFRPHELTPSSHDTARGHDRHSPPRVTRPCTQQACGTDMEAQESARRLRATIRALQAERSAWSAERSHILHERTARHREARNAAPHEAIVHLEGPPHASSRA